MDDQGVLQLTDLTVGVLYNLPAPPSRGEAMDYVAEREVEEQVDAVEDALDRLGLAHQRFPLTEDVEDLVTGLKAYTPDVVINLCEGAFGDSRFEMNVPSLLELLGVPYTGSPPLALGLCQHKGLAKAVLRTNGIPTPDYQILRHIDEWAGGLTYPLFVKPVREDGSVGITKACFVQDAAALKRRVEYLLTRYQQPALVERYMAGRELNVALLGHPRPTVLPISEIVFTSPEEPKIVDYAAKWLRESDEYRQTSPVSRRPPPLHTSHRRVVGPGGIPGLGLPRLRPHRHPLEGRGALRSRGQSQSRPRPRRRLRTLLEGGRHLLCGLHRTPHRLRPRTTPSSQ